MKGKCMQQVKETFAFVFMRLATRTTTTKTNKQASNMEIALRPELVSSSSSLLLLLLLLVNWL